MDECLDIAEEAIEEAEDANAASLVSYGHAADYLALSDHEFAQGEDCDAVQEEQLAIMTECADIADEATSEAENAYAEADYWYGQAEEWYALGEDWYALGEQAEAEEDSTWQITAIMKRRPVLIPQSTAVIMLFIMRG